MPSQLADADWSLLLARLERGACTPFLGAGVNLGRALLPGDIAMKWAEDGGYPLEDRWNFPRVAQFMAVEKGATWVRRELAETLSAANPVDAADADDPLNILAELPFTTYVTTTQDDLLTRALRTRSVTRGGKSLPRRPRYDHCRWSDALSSSSLATAFEEDPHYQPSTEEPFVFHLYGQMGVGDSMVITEEDHFDLLVATARHPTRVPPPVQRALRGGPLLFIGHAIADWNFRALTRSLCGGDFTGLQQGSLTVHAPLAEGGEAVVRMIERSYARLGVKVYWGTPQEFLKDLRERWSQRSRS